MYFTQLYRVCWQLIPNAYVLRLVRGIQLRTTTKRGLLQPESLDPAHKAREVGI